MIESATKYIQHTKFQLLENWSVQYLIESTFLYNPIYKLAKIGDFLIRSRNQVEIENGKSYQRVTIKINNGGVIPRDIENGELIGTKLQYRINEGQFLMSKIDARNGAFGIVPKELEGAVVTNDFPTFNINRKVINPEFLVLITTTKEFVKFAQSCSSGTTNRQRINISAFLNVKIPLPTLEEQNQIVEAYNKRIAEAERLEKEAKQLEEGIEEYLIEELGIEKKYFSTEKKRILRIISYKNLSRWDSNESQILKSKYPIMRIGQVIRFISTGTTPPTNRKEYFENGEINFYTPADLGEDMFLFEAERKLSQKAVEGKKARKFEKGTLLFVGIGSTIGKVGVVGNDFATSNQQITGLVFNNDLILTEYAFHYFNKFKQITIREKTQATIPIINQDNIKNIPVPVPPIEVQNSIVFHIIAIKEEIKGKKELAVTNRQQAISEFESKIFMPCN